ncbi:DUF6629 family protein [Streptomyces sp. NPDC003016]
MCARSNRTGDGGTCVRRSRARDLPLAALPLLLGTHRIIEAVIRRSGGGTGPATVAWAVITLPLPALWVPVGVVCAAPPHARRRLLVPLAVAVATAASLAYCPATRPVTAEIRGRTLGYVLDLPHPALLVAGYFLATVGSLLLTDDRRLRLLGALVAFGAAVCAALWRPGFISAWCAFAAVCPVVPLEWHHRCPAASAPPGTPAAGL